MGTSDFNKQTSGRSDGHFHNAVSVGQLLTEAKRQIDGVLSSLQHQRALSEIRRLIEPAKTFLTITQLEQDDRYFIRGLRRLEEVALYLIEYRMGAEANKLRSACSMLRDTYCLYHSQKRLVLDGCKVAAEFSNFDATQNLVDEKCSRRIQAHLLSIALTGKKYLENINSSSSVDKIDADADIAEHGKFIRDAYYKLNRVKLALVRLQKMQRGDSDLNLKGAIALIPESEPPIAFNFRPSETEPETGLVGIRAFAQEVANIIICSEILRTHSSNAFGELSESLASMARSLTEVLNSYCNHIGGKPMGGSLRVPPASELRRHFFEPLVHAIDATFHHLTQKPEYKPQAACMRLALAEWIKSPASLAA